MSKLLPVRSPYYRFGLLLLKILNKQTNTGTAGLDNFSSFQIFVNICLMD